MPILSLEVMTNTSYPSQEGLMSIIGSIYHVSEIDCMTLHRFDERASIRARIRPKVHFYRVRRN